MMGRIRHRSGLMFLFTGWKHVFFTGEGIHGARSFASNKHAMEPRTQAFGIKRIATYGLLMIGCSAYGQRTAVPTTAARVSTVEPLVDCVQNNLDDDRRKFYGETLLNAREKQFHEHFRLKDQSAKIMNTPLAIPWKAIDSTMALVESPLHHIGGIFFNYGIDGANFQPVIDFMFVDKTNGDNLKVLADASFELIGSNLVNISSKRRDELLTNYLTKVEVSRVGTAYSSICAGDGTCKADPLGIWFQFPNDINNLLAQNPVTDTVLVLTCMSERLCYRSLQPLAPDEPEYRHLLSLHIADGTVNMLKDMEDPGKLFWAKAMDLGHLCPPRCY